MWRPLKLIWVAELPPSAFSNKDKRPGAVAAFFSKIPTLYGFGAVVEMQLGCSIVCRNSVDTVIGAFGVVVVPEESETASPDSKVTRIFDQV